MQQIGVECLGVDMIYGRTPYSVTKKRTPYRVNMHTSYKGFLRGPNIKSLFHLIF